MGLTFDVWQRKDRLKSFVQRTYSNSLNPYLSDLVEI